MIALNPMDRIKAAITSPSGTQRFSHPLATPTTPPITAPLHT